MESTSQNDTSQSDINQAGAAGLANPRLWVVSETSSQGMNPQFREPGTVLMAGRLLAAGARRRGRTGRRALARRPGKGSRQGTRTRADPEHWGWPSPPGCGVGPGDVAGDGLGAGAGVALEGPDGGVAGPGEQHRGAGAVLGTGSAGCGRSCSRSWPSRAERTGRCRCPVPGWRRGRPAARPGPPAGGAPRAGARRPWPAPAARR